MQIGFRRRRLLSNCEPPAPKGSPLLTLDPRLSQVSHFPLVAAIHGRSLIFPWCEERFQPTAPGDFPSAVAWTETRRRFPEGKARPSFASAHQSGFTFSSSLFFWSFACCWTTCIDSSDTLQIPVARSNIGCKADWASPLDFVLFNRLYQLSARSRVFSDRDHTLLPLPSFSIFTRARI
ncbi:uncharacterized protein BP01DRAFT_2149 [Aspergillus saccharolyticus JOP 1030-1]|uniref:Uncharacterized protein n=1 Tax=Aspergillus saccharolyticus JOP 1030-1 TaxID=1450539 RepID=A0A318ZRC2_9EURO|nr:hypothetical protein BP01DRAFT_2149 [Aspergillus saccharolyticus JOP 1030-1]PYH49617.1 hypothetical protein BP01DRAFT_2149 [Aspergillus saccharolyticus JOP 1030-1]